MEKYLFADEGPEKRLQSLKSTADEVVNETYYQRLTKEELTAKKEKQTDNAVKLDILEEQRKKAADEFKMKMKPFQHENKILVKEIRTGFEEKEGELFKYIDEQTRMVHFYDCNGELIETKTRPANSDELQNTIYMGIRNTGTHD